MSQTDQVYIPVRESGRGRAGQQSSPPLPSNTPRHQPAGPASRSTGGGGGGSTNGGGQYVLRLESPQKQRRKRSSLFDGHGDDDDVESSNARSSGDGGARKQQQSRNVSARTGRRVENENPHSVLNDFAKNIRASQDELSDMNKAIEEKKRQLQTAQKKAAEAVLESGKLKRRVAHGAAEAEESEDATRRLDVTIRESLTRLMEALARARTEVKTDLEEGRREMEELEARFCDLIEAEADKLAAANREQEAEVERLEKELAEADAELETLEEAEQVDQARLDTADAAVAELNSTDQDLDKCTRAARAAILEATAQQDATTHEFEQEQARSTLLQQEAEKAETDAKEAMAQVESKIATQQKKNDNNLVPRLEIEQKKAELEQQGLNAMKADITRAKEDHADSKKSIESAEERAKKLHEDMKVALQTAQELKDKIMACEQEKREADAQHDRLTAEWHGASEAYDVLRTQVDEVRDAVTMLRGKLEVRVREVKQQLENENAEAKERNAGLEREIKAIKATRADYETATSDLKKEVAAKQETVQRLKDDMKNAEEARVRHQAHLVAQKVAFAEELELTLKKVEETRRRAEELQAEHKAAQEAADAVTTEHRSETEKVALMEAQLQSILDGSSFTEADHAWINQEAQKRLAEETREVNTRHEAEKQELLQTLKRITEDEPAKLEKKKAAFEAKCRALTEELEKSRLRVEELRCRAAEEAARLIAKRRQEEEEFRQQQQQEEETRKQQQEARRKQEEEEEARQQQQQQQQEAARAKQQKQDEVNRKKREKEAAISAKRQQKLEEAERKKRESKENAAHLKRQKEEEAEEARLRSAQVKSQSKRKSSRSSRHRDEQEAEDEEADKDPGDTGDGRSPAHDTSQVLPQAEDDWGETMADESPMPDDDAGFPENSTARAPLPSPPPASRRHGDESSVLSREAMAAFEDTPSGSRPVRFGTAEWERENSHRPDGVPPQRPASKPRRHSAPSAATSEVQSPPPSQDPFFRGRSHHTFIPDDASMTTRPGGPKNKADGNARGRSSPRVEEEDDEQVPQMPSGRPSQPQRRSISEARAAKQAAFAANKKPKPPARSVSVSTSRITIEETHTTYENPRGRDSGPAKKAPSSKSSGSSKAKPKRSQSMEAGDEWFQDDDDPYVFGL